MNVKKVILASALISSLLGCKINEKYEGFYVNAEYGQALIASDDPDETMLIDFNEGVAYVTLEASQDDKSITYSRFKEGHDSTGTWQENAGSHFINFSDDDSVRSSQLNSTLLMFKSDSIRGIHSDWNFDPVSKAFTFTASNGSTYEGVLEEENDGFWELDNDYSFTDSSGVLSRNNAELLLFIEDGKTYSIFYDKHLNSSVVIDLLESDDN